MTGSTFAAAQSPQPTQTVAEATEDFVVGCRILFDQGVIVDGFGHMSFRSPVDPNRFFMGRARASGMITAGDVIEFDLDGKPVDPKSPRAFLERYIHAAIYKARPDVNAVVHSHAPSVLPFSVTGTPLRPVSHMGSFLGGPVPVFEIRDAGGDATNMLVINQELGAAVAKSLGQSSVVLMRGHGFNAVGSSVRQVVFRSIYTDINARVLAEALKMGNVAYLNDKEAAKAAATLDGLIERSWEIWRFKALANTPKL
jgi:HCOMODA/2-hydroxy-3-carboxy-muconic semialdehyde decarboxylase